MGSYKLTQKAEEEIEGIYEYSILNFGLSVAQEYVIGFHKCFEILTDNVSWGNDYGNIEPGLLRYEYQSHSIYYQVTEDGILILKVLGSKQDPARHF